MGGQKRNRQNKRKKVRPPEGRRAFFRNASGFGGEETEKSVTPLTLDGSDDTTNSNEFDASEQVCKPSLKSRASRHIREIVITGALIPLLFGIGRWVIETKAEQKYFGKLIDDMKEQINQLDSSKDDPNFVTKENLELKLEILKRDLEAMVPDISEIEKRIDALEEDVADLTDKNNTSDK